jgi:hypothetical protein
MNINAWQSLMPPMSSKNSKISSDNLNSHSGT